MKKNLAKLLTLLLVVVMITALFAGCKDDKTAEPTKAPDASTPDVTKEPDAPYVGGDTFVVGYDTFSQKFSPFFATTGYDVDVAAMTGIGLLGMDREGNMVLKGIEGEVRAYNGKDYTYKGVADCVVTQNDDGTVTYDLTMRDDIVFSDGTPVTIDDVIFSMYVLCDPAYDGSSTLYAQPIQGVNEYRSGMEAIINLIAAAGPDAVDSHSNEEQTAKFWEVFPVAGEKFAQEIVDYCAENAGTTDVTAAAAVWGYELEAGATTADFFNAIVEAKGYGLGSDGINFESAGTSITDFLYAELGELADQYAIGVQTGDSAATITGIQKTGDYSLRIVMDSFDATAIYQLGVTIAPLHYYGNKDAYNYEANQFGFTKGDLSGVKSKTTQPVGAGPYKFISYENGVVTFERNESYYLGCPKITNILFQETNSGDKLTGVASGSFDLSDPPYSNEAVDSIKGYNTDTGETDGAVLTTISVDNLGYGYIGLNADTMNVGGVPDSQESKDLRKAFATMLSVHRDVVINSYYGERAAVINYPISNTSWAAPRPADEGYEIAYSTDVDGNPIYNDSMSEQEKYDAALEAAKGFLIAAGYTWDEATSKFTAAPEGATLAYEIIIPADGIGDHPVYGICTSVKDELASIGITLEINDPSDSNVLWNKLDAGTQNMWCAAWQATPDPDMYQVYHSSNVVGKGGTDSNHYHIADATLDEYIMAARGSSDQAYRKSTYKDCLNILLDWAVEIPTYQRQNAYVVSTERVNVATITPDITPFWTWMNDLELLEMN